ncbi:protein kinase ALK2 NDAI_0A03300 [Naumovozyma dairenensis CBS 421]|uniref:non-specific serine/threonine protein kinase n=1 Tax=Naumovozyma dairenensis (strain ATCC 10597 / BCRC 20456 / CBS 421 / NBRC 0211 / NRRL Y-12639) TaxID=1071378 RepID=G0W3U9_NAUDC|nr:hypothetical protein NDAI_0A03300 [Naumovozyma dairenensis CBS 421]CCD22487.1 hypothetical protein NDAI_0A03300 [Naumovozyma dairenensis CBS 421]
MDYDTSYDEFVEGKKFIALVVSDDDEDELALTDINESFQSTSASSIPTIKNNIAGSTFFPNIPNNPHIVPKSSSQPSQKQVLQQQLQHNQLPLRTPTKEQSKAIKTKSDEKKRWSFMSTTSSSKKRWSTLSSFTNDSKNEHVREKEKHSSHNSSTNNPNFMKRLSSHSSSISTTNNSTKRMSLTSTFSNHLDKNSNQAIHADSHNDNISLSSSSSSTHRKSSSSSLKRSSTGSSLRQLFNKIVINDSKEHQVKSTQFSSSQENANKENNCTQNNSQKQLPKQLQKQKQLNHSFSYSSDLNQNTIRTDTNASQTKFRTPLKPVTNTFTTNSNAHMARQRHSVIYHQDYNNNNNSSNGYNNSKVNHNRNISTNQFSDSSSISSMSSSNSKWKFWKRNTSNNGGFLSSSTSSKSLSINDISSPYSIENNNNKFNYNNPSTKLRNKSSFSDFHKPFFSSNSSTQNLSINTQINTDQNETRSISSLSSSSLHKKISTSNLSIHALTHRSSQSSLKHKVSHSSLQKFKTRRRSSNNGTTGANCLNPNMDDISSHSSSINSNPLISLPTLDQVSRDKIQTKLRNSTSLLSLNSSHTVIMTKKQHDTSILQQILQYCDINYIINEYDLQSLHSNFNKHSIYMLTPQNSIKISSNIYKLRSKQAICKIIPLGTPDDITTSKITSLKELKMLHLVKGTTGLPYLLQSYLLRSSTGNISMYLYMKDKGTPLSTFKFVNWDQVLNIFWQCVNIMYVSETKFQFEHRNLILDHILIDSNHNVTFINLKCGRIKFDETLFPNSNSNTIEILSTRLDHPLFFQGGGDYQFETYNLMRSLFNGLNVTSGNNKDDETIWDCFVPKTNLLWLHYIAVKLLLNNNNLPNSESRIKLNSIAQLSDPATLLPKNKNKYSRRNDHNINSCGDLLKFK